MRPASDTSLDFRAIDADNHYYEPPDCFSRHIEPRFRDQAVTATQHKDGRWEVRVGSKPWNFFDPKFDKTNPPGSLLATLRAKDSDASFKWSDSYSTEHMLPAFKQRDDRLRLMDEQGIEATIMLPTFGLSVPAVMVDDADQTHANFRSFNRWLEEDWGFGADGRIYAPPVLPLLDVDQAVAELDRVMALGARIIAVVPGPIGNGRSPADPIYDPIWARINEAEILLALHLGDSRYPEISAMWGEPENPSVREQTAFQFAFVSGDRPIMETFGQLIYGNLFGRFPNIRALSIENGSDWVRYLLGVMDKKKGMARYSRWIGGRPAGRPSDIFKRHCWVAPYPEDDVDALIDLIGADRVLFGSDYPHPEGLARPIDFADLMQRATSDEKRLVMRTNSGRLLGLEA